LLESAGFSKSNPYYIVQQGKVNALCLSKDEERLHLLKEVAGTRVYEERREESNAIIAETNSKREKIQEVITYIEERLEELEGEKEELSAYQKCDRDKRALEYTIYDKELRKAREQIDALETQRGDDAAKVRELHDRERATQDDIDAHKRSLADAENESDKGLRERKAAEKERSRFVTQRAKLEVDVKEMEERVSGDAETQASLTTEAEDLDKQIEVVKNDLEEKAQPAFEGALERQSVAQQEKAQVDLQVNELLAKQGRGQRFTTTKERDTFLKEQLAGLEQSVELKSAEVKKLEKRVKEAAAQLKGSAKGQSTKETEAKGRQGEMARITKEIAANTEKRHALAEERKAKWHSKQAVDDEVKKWRDELATHERAFRASMPRHIAQGLEALEQIVAKDKVAGYYGPLVDNFKLANPKYRVPVEVAANNALFNVIVEDDEVASRLIAKLTKDNLGRVTFMPLRQLQVHQETYPTSSDVHPLIKVGIKYDKKVEKAMLQVFGKKLIARDFDTARQFAREANMDAITMDGDEVNRKGALEGGFHDERRSRLGAYVGMEEAKGKLADAVARQVSVQQENVALDQKVSDLMGSIQRDEAKRANLRMVSGQAAQELKQMEEDRSRLEDRRQKDQTETLPGAKKEVAALSAQADSFRAEIGTPLQHTLSAAERSTLTKLKTSATKLSSEVDEAPREVEEVSVERQRLQSLLKDNLLRQRAEITEKLSSSGGDGLGGDAEVGERAEALAQKAAELVSVRREADTIGEQLRRLDKRAAERKEAVRLAKSKLSELQAQEASDAEALADVEKQTEKQLNKRSMLAQKREENLRKIQQLGSLPAAELEEHAGNNVKELMKKLHKVNQELTKYSHVNKKALDQYVNFSEQREALLERRTELDKGSEAIDELIEALDRQKDEAILRTFKGVSKHFNEVFKELVPLGRGQLIMRTSADREDGAGGGAPTDDDGDDGGGSSSLAAGGKKGKKKAAAAASSSSSSSSAAMVHDFEGVQVRVSFTPNGEVYLMSQLSGGQKALVALSIIFAIQRCDPAPFYLFDELDQALDSTYRAAVAAMIQRQANASSNATQFITTTFRPELVNVASKCYGISLQNKNSNIHALSKGDALGFVADLMNEEEAVGQASAAPLPRAGASAKKRLQAEQPVEEDQEEDAEGGEEENDDDEADEEDEEEEEEAPKAKGKRKGRR
jgi:structural maintenance of chromosome 3 (chondroitin sulfate proteoglycan 6)